MADRFILTAMVIVAGAVLAAVYKWTRFGLATRAAASIGIMYSLLQYASAQTWFPPATGIAISRNHRELWLV